MVVTEIDVLVIRPGENVARRQRIEARWEALRDLVGGYIESLTLSPRISTYINEEGKFQGLPYNEAGDLFVKAVLGTQGRSLMPGDGIVGPLVIVGPPDRVGNETNVDEEAVEICHVLQIPVE